MQLQQQRRAAMHLCRSSRSRWGRRYQLGHGPVGWCRLVRVAVLRSTSVRLRALLMTSAGRSRWSSCWGVLSVTTSRYVVFDWDFFCCCGLHSTMLLCRVDPAAEA